MTEELDTFVIYSDGLPVCTVRAREAWSGDGVLYLSGTEGCVGEPVAVFIGKAVGAVRKNCVEEPTE